MILATARQCDDALRLSCSQYDSGVVSCPPLMKPINEAKRLRNGDQKGRSGEGKGEGRRRVSQ